MKKTGRLYKTLDYNIFINNNENREVKENKKLTASMVKYGFIDAHPIHVVQCGEKLRVMDGAHRLSTAKKLSLPIYYIVSNVDDVTISEINNTQRKWSLYDYLESWVKQGKTEYIKVSKYQEEYSLPLTTSIVLLGEYSNYGGQGVLDRFKNGDFVCKNLDSAYEIGDVVVVLSKINKRVARSRFFITALLKCMRIDFFDAGVFIHAVKTHSHLFQPQPDWKSYAEMIHEIYNWHKPKKSKLNIRFEVLG